MNSLRQKTSPGANLQRPSSRWRGPLVLSGAAAVIVAAAWLPQLRRGVPQSENQPAQAGEVVQSEPATGAGKPFAIHANDEHRRAALVALEQDSPSGRAAAFEVIAAQWMKADPLASMAWARQVSNLIERERVQRIFVRIWATLDAPAAAAFVASEPDGTVRQQWIRELATEWASADPRAATAWAMTLTAGRGRDVAFECMARVTVATQPELAVQLSQAIASPDRFQESFHETVYQWSQTDAAAAVNWLRRLPEGDVTRALAVHAAADAWSALSPADAAVEMARLPEDELRGELVSEAARRWAETNPEDATRWAVGALDDGLREHVLAEVVQVWAGMDPTGVVSWLNGLAAGLARDQLVASFSTAIEESHPERAMEWASTIADNAMLRAKLEEVRDAWAEQDPSAARAWVAKSLLPAALKAQLLNGE